MLEALKCFIVCVVDSRIPSDIAQLDLTVEKPLRQDVVFIKKVLILPLLNSLTYQLAYCV